ncbi:hypothetical protein K525DRAFT_186971 [Schizophyllum commune Loenen D]|nr:hypothetical protein K525DRAFT_186971 [Schizophyllum commune Loenen D]
MYDLLCALCSAPCTTPEYTGPQVFDYSDTALSLGEGYERWLSLSANQWLEHLRAVGVNSAHTGAKRCYISGIGTNTYSSSICVEPGDHPNAPTTVGGSNDLVDLDAYCCWKSTRNGMGVFPVHFNCLNILKMVFQQEGLDLDADILYESFRDTLLTYSFANQFGDSGFDCDIVIDSNDMVTFVPQSEESEEESFVSDPVDIRGLKEYLENPPIIKAHVSAPSRHAECASRAQDPFASLPCELLLMVMLLIPKDSLQPFFLASPAARSIWLPNTFFRARLAVDMPWAWEIIEGPLFRRTDVDWRRVYTHLRKEADREWSDDMPGLANRRRIWDICVCGKAAATYRRLAAKAEKTASATNVA